MSDSTPPKLNLKALKMDIPDIPKAPEVLVDAPIISEIPVSVETTAPVASVVPVVSPEPVVIEHKIEKMSFASIRKDVEEKQVKEEASPLEASTTQENPEKAQNPQVLVANIQEAAPAEEKSETLSIASEKEETSKGLETLPVAEPKALSASTPIVEKTKVTEASLSIQAEKKTVPAETKT